MGMFGFGKKKEESACCCCGGACNNETVEKVQPVAMEGARIKVLGSGCVKCHTLEAATKEALQELKMDIAIEHVTDFNVIAGYGVMVTPALVINEKVVSMGKVLKKDEVIKLLENSF